MKVKSEKNSHEYKFKGLIENNNWNIGDGMFQTSWLSTVFNYVHHFSIPYCRQLRVDCLYFYKNYRIVNEV
jgi:hypothetical protein